MRPPLPRGIKGQAEADHPGDPLVAPTDGGSPYVDFDMVDSVHGSAGDGRAWSAHAEARTSSVGSAYTDFDAIDVVARDMVARRPRGAMERRQRRSGADAVERRQQRLLRARRWSQDQLDDDGWRSASGTSRVERVSIRTGRVRRSRSRPAEAMPVDAPAVLTPRTTTLAPGGGPSVRMQTPDLTGLDLLPARALATECGLDITVTLAESPSGRSGSVVSQWPEAGTPVRTGGRVHVVVASTVQVAVPDVVGLAIDDAELALRARGLRVIRELARRSRASGAIRVARTRPSSGELVAAGSIVRLVSDEGEPGRTIDDGAGATAPSHLRSTAHG